MTDNKYKTGKIYTIRYKKDDNLIYEVVQLSTAS